MLLWYFSCRNAIGFKADWTRSTGLVEIERGKSERLLLNILPAHVAQRLKEQPGNLADGFADVSVMFADLVDFTRMSQELTPAQVVEMLDEVFTLFDKLAEKHRLDKIKTIGDAYMVVGGLTRNDKQDHVVSIADMALEMLESDPRRFAALANGLESSHWHRDRSGDGRCDRRNPFHL